MTQYTTLEIPTYNLKLNLDTEDFDYTDTKTLQASEKLSLYKVISLDNLGYGVYSDKDTKLSVITVQGISVASDSTSVTVKTSGTVTNPEWDFNPDSYIFLNSNGELSTIPASTGFSVRVGIALSQTSVLINISEPIKIII